MKLKIFLIFSILIFLLTFFFLKFGNIKNDNSTIEKEYNDKKELLLLSLFEYWTESNSLRLENETLIYVPKSACSYCLEKLFLYYDGKGMLSNTVLVLENTDWAKYVDNLNERYIGKFNYFVKKSILSENFDDLIMIKYWDGAPSKLKILDINEIVI